MSRLLQELLGEHEPIFSLALQRLEAFNGKPSADVRLTADIITTARRKTQELGLDPSDTDGRELYHGLQALVGKHDQFIYQRLGRPEDPARLLKSLATLSGSLDVPRQCWTCKPAAIKRLLKQDSPRQAMRLLGYKSLDSMLKRADVTEILTAAYICESQTWWNRFRRLEASLSPQDFEVRGVHVEVLDAVRWRSFADQTVAERHDNVIIVPELATISLLPLPMSYLPGLSLALLATIIHSMSELRSLSAYCKLQQMQNGFGRKVAAAFADGPPTIADMFGRELTWQGVQRHFALRIDEFLELFEPHLSAEDLAWQPIAASLYKLEPALKFWEDTEFVGSSDSGQPISFNLLDNAIGLCNNLAYGQRLSVYLQQSLAHQLVKVYVGQERTEQSVVEQLADMIMPLGKAVLETV